MHDFVSFARFKYLDRWLIPELSLNHVVQGVKVDAVVTFFDGTNVADSGKIEHTFAVQANDTPFVQLEEALVFVNDD